MIDVKFITSAKINLSYSLWRKDGEKFRSLISLEECIVRVQRIIPTFTLSESRDRVGRGREDSIVLLFSYVWGLSSFLHDVPHVVFGAGEGAVGFELERGHGGGEMACF